MNSSDERVIYKCIESLINLEKVTKKGKTKADTDRDQVSHLHSMAALYCDALMDKVDSLSEKKIDGYVQASKQLLLVYGRIMYRHSGLIGRRFRKSIYNLIVIL